MAEYSEKRDFLRMPIDCELSFSQSGSDRSMSGNVINLSHKGILFTSSQKFDEGANLDIVLTPSNSGTPPFEADGVVSRVTPYDEIYEIACEIQHFK